MKEINGEMYYTCSDMRDEIIKHFEGEPVSINWVRRAVSGGKRTDRQGGYIYVYTISPVVSQTHVVRIGGQSLVSREGLEEVLDMRRRLRNWRVDKKGRGPWEWSRSEKEEAKINQEEN